jgi:bacterioferritin-associated ferredoxin
MILCICRGISERDIREAVRCGARTIDDVSRSCDGAGGDCGSCRARIERQLEVRLEHVQG